MRRWLVGFLFLGLLEVSCSSLKDKADNKQFHQLTQEFLQDYWKAYPQQASNLGLRDYDPILSIPSEKTRQNQIQFAQNYLKRFKTIGNKTLSVSQEIDRVLIINKLETILWSINSFQEYQWNPALYNLTGAISKVLKRKDIPLEERLKTLHKKLSQSPLYYREAQKSLYKPTLEHSRLAIQETGEFIKYLQKNVKKKIRLSKLSKKEQKAHLQALIQTIRGAKKFQTFLRRILARPQRAGVTRSFRISPELYAQKFKYHLQMESSPGELYQKALLQKAEVQLKMFEMATALYPKYYGSELPPKSRQEVIVNILRKVSKNHTRPKQFVSTIREQIPQLIKFIKEHKILSLPPHKSLKVRKTPFHERGFYRASIDPPGPFEKEKETFYNISPLDGLSPKRQKSYLREYNNYTLQILNIHEAFPGHYTQLLYSHQSLKPLRSIFKNHPTGEGWAVYAERMMLEEGYGHQSPELWLMYYKWFLRVVTNTIMDYEIHHQNLTKNQAMKLMVTEAFQEPTEAQAKWNRAILSQVQLTSYFAGFTEIYELREKIKKEKGSRFNLKTFHEQFLGFGMAPVKEIKKLL